MGVRGYFAYHYNKKYYRKYAGNFAFPSYLGVDFGDDIPKDAVKREAWIYERISMIETQIAYRAQNGIPDNEKCDEFRDIRDTSNWMLGGLWVDWTYVVDLDARVLTINGTLHFKLENIPDLRLLEPHGDPSSVPPEYFTPVSLWPEPEFDVQDVQREYDGHQSIIVPATKWGGPTWDTLSVSQHLSAQLVRTLVQDCAYELALVEFPRIHRRIGLFCWRMVTAAAPSVLVCPPDDAPPSSNATCVAVDRSIKLQTPTVDSRMTSHGFLNRYYWFRGCLITFCIRLDKPAFVAHEVNKIVLKLRDKGRKASVGLIVSSWQVVAISTNGSEVRHSPALIIHDNKGELKDGLLLMVHLLSPILTGVTKVPWASTPFIRSTSAISQALLPHEIMEHIIYLMDFDTYRNIPLVSQLFRRIYLSHPRVGHHTLLGKDPGSGLAFKTQSASGGPRSAATLTRIKPTREHYEYRPPQKYRLHRTTVSALNPGLAGSFQYHRHRSSQRATIASDTIAQQIEKRRAEDTKPEPSLVELNWKVAAGPTTLSDIRLQVLDGVWRMVRDISEMPFVEEPPESIRDHESHLYNWYDKRGEYVGIWYNDSPCSGSESE